MQLGERKLKILQAIIDDYINTAEPVGSRTIAKKYGIGISSATIRNEMSDLEEMGYLEQPHTSAGRIPSDKAYRLYVDKLMKATAPSKEQMAAIKEYYEKKLEETEKVIIQTAKVLSDLTNYTSLVLSPQLNKVVIRRIQLVAIDKGLALVVVVTSAGIVKDSIIRIPETVEPGDLEKISNMLTEKLNGHTIMESGLVLSQAMKSEFIVQRELVKRIADAINKSIFNPKYKDVYLWGATNIFNFPEYHDIVKAKTFLSILEEKPLLFDLMIRGIERDINITIGEENDVDEIKDCSIITATYKINDKTIGTIGIIGPTRMPYSNIISVIEHVEKKLSGILTEMSNE
ncbi:MAG: heat-inducible transcriptional repressor HrcA [Mahellales bacterium]|jgi:heat-inducible transcriptional repressor